MGLTQVSTDGVKNDAITKTKIPANQIEASELADNAVDTNAIQNDAVTGSKINANAVGTTQLLDTSVTLAKLEHGTGSNDGKFLRANNGADPSFETITGTTINNNADNRVITGSGTANTLNAESNLSWTGTLLNGTGNFDFNGADTSHIATHFAGNFAKLDFRGTGDAQTNKYLVSYGTGHANVNQFHMVNTLGDLVFRPQGGTERMRLTAGGLTFNGDTAAANAISDYEEGTFTPSYNTTADNLTFNGGSRTNASLYNSRKGSYVKIGKRIWFQISLSTNSLTSVGGSDFIAVDGLPFTAENDTNRPRFVMACQAGRFDSTNTFVPLFLVVNPGTTLCQVRQDFETQKTVSSFNVTGSTNRNVIECFGSYEVA